MASQDNQMIAGIFPGEVIIIEAGKLYGPAALRPTSLTKLVDQFLPGQAIARRRDVTYLPAGNLMRGGANWRLSKHSSWGKQ